MKLAHGHSRVLHVTWTVFVNTVIVLAFGDEFDRIHLRKLLSL